jgi:hypothetical protein
VRLVVLGANLFAGLLNLCGIHRLKHLRRWWGLLPVECKCNLIMVVVCPIIVFHRKQLPKVAIRHFTLVQVVSTDFLSPIRVSVLALVSNLDTILLSLIAKMHEIILMFDGNKSMSERKSAIARLAQKHHLIDLHVHKHGTQDEPATYNRGTKRINLALGTPTIAAEMTAIGYEEFNAEPFSDHRSLFVDVKVQNILLGDAVNMVPAKQGSKTR